MPSLFLSHVSTPSYVSKSESLCCLTRPLFFYTKSLCWVVKWWLYHANINKNKNKAATDICAVGKNCFHSWAKFNGRLKQSCRQVIRSSNNTSLKNLNAQHLQALLQGFWPVTGDGSVVSTVLTEQQGTLVTHCLSCYLQTLNMKSGCDAQLRSSQDACQLNMGEQTWRCLTEYQCCSLYWFSQSLLLEKTPGLMELLFWPSLCIQLLVLPFGQKVLPLQ